MSEVMNLDLAENLVLNYLAEKNAKKSTGELQDELGLNRVIITRVLRNAKNSKPAQVALDGGKYKFVGNKNALSPIPEDVRVKFGLESSYHAANQSTEGVESNVNVREEGLGPIDRQVLELLTTRKKFPQSGLMKQFNLEEDEAESILSGLEENELVVSEHLEGFDENSFSLSEKGKAVVERMFGTEQPRMEAQVVREAPGVTHEVSAPSGASIEEKEPMVSSGRTFEIPSFDDIPEENASGRGRPTGDRDFEKLRVYILAYIQKNQPVAKSNISRTLAKVLSNFGRQTIVEEVDRLVALDYVEEQTIGKREMFTLSETGSNTLNEIVIGKSVQPMVKGEAAPAPKKATEQKKPSAPQKARPSAQAEQTKPSIPAPAPTEKADLTKTEEPSRPYVEVSRQASNVDADDVNEIKGKIEALLRDVPGERGFELRHYFYELSQRIRALEKSRSDLSDFCQSLVRKI